MKKCAFQNPTSLGTRTGPEDIVLGFKEENQTSTQVALKVSRALLPGNPDGSRGHFLARQRGRRDPCEHKAPSCPGLAALALVSAWGCVLGLAVPTALPGLPI